MIDALEHASLEGRAAAHYPEDVLAFGAPYLEDKLLLERIVFDRSRAVAGFDEVRRYLVICDADDQFSYPMISRFVDEVWHQFVLFTVEYTRFCQRYFGHYVHHAPSNAPKRPGARQRPEVSRETFIATYERRFGALPDVWLDREHLSPASRLVVNEIDDLAVAEEDGARVALRARFGDDRGCLFRTAGIARAALEFAVSSSTFFVRELAGLASADQLILARALVDHGVARIVG